MSDLAALLQQALDEVSASQTLAELAQEAGPDAPLCVIAHSLGTIIASNYLYDLQVDPVKHLIGDNVRAFLLGVSTGV